MHYTPYTSKVRTLTNTIVSDQTEGPFAGLWSKTGKELRRAPFLANDLSAVHAEPGDPSVATQQYLEAIRAASAGDGSRLFGHFWCRYFADLYGGRALGMPTMFAVDALSQAPQFYSFPSSVTADRHTYIDKLYGTINEHADPLGPDAAEAIVEEGRIAFRHNAAVLQ